MSPGDVFAGALRWVEYAGLLGFVGVIVVRVLAAHPPGLRWARPRMDIVLAVALAGGLATLLDQIVVSGSIPGPVVVRVAAEALALGLCRTTGRGAVPVGFLAVVAVAFAGHATQLNPALPAIAIDALHVVSAGMWAGGLVALAALHPPAGWAGGEGRLMAERFGRVATIAFALTAMTGLVRATEELTGVSDLWTTGYGIVMTAKTAGVVAMLAMSALTWRRGLPLARLEAALALAVMGATALLASFPVPPGAA